MFTYRWYQYISSSSSPYEKLICFKVLWILAGDIEFSLCVIIKQSTKYIHLDRVCWLLNHLHHRTSDLSSRNLKKVSMVTIACHSTCTFYQKNMHFDDIFCDVLLTSRADKPVVIRSASLPDPSSLTTWHTDIAAYPKAGCLLTTLKRLALITGTTEDWLKIRVSNYMWKVSEQMLQRSLENTWN